MLIRKWRGVSAGDRIQFTASQQELHVANRALGTIEQIAPDGSITAKMDNGKIISFDLQVTHHFDLGYAVTSHSAQGFTADRVLVHVDNAAHPDLVNNRFAYVAVSRASFEARIFTDDASRLPTRLSTEIDKSAAIDFSQAVEKSLSSSLWSRVFRSVYEARVPILTVKTAQRHFLK